MSTTFNSILPSLNTPTSLPLTPLPSPKLEENIALESKSHSNSASLTQKYHFSQGQLDRFYQHQDSQFLSERYIVHLLADSFLNNTTHVGWFADDAILHMIVALEENNVFEGIEPILKNLKECLVWQEKILANTPSILATESDTQLEESNVVNELKEAAKNLKIGEVLLFPGGAIDHSVLFELRRDGEDDYSFLVYNTGDGVSNHWMLVDDGNLKIKGVYELNHISMEAIESTQLFSLLIDLKMSDTDLFGELLYDDILGKLQGRRAEIPLDHNQYMQSQRAGTCSWKMLCAYLRYNLPLIEYKYLKLKMRLDVFQKWYDWKKSLDCKKINQKLLSKLLVNYKAAVGMDGELPLSLTKEEILAFGILKVQKNFNRYKYLLTQETIAKTEEWFEAFAGSSIYDYEPQNQPMVLEKTV